MLKPGESSEALVAGGHVPVDLSDAVAMYDGRQLFGFVLLDAGSVHAFGPSEDYVGLFADREQAVRALRAHANRDAGGS